MKGENNMSMIDITPLLEAVVKLLAAVIALYLIPWLRTKYSAEQLRKAQDVVHIAVYAAEKLYGAGHGADKLEYAEEILAAHGVKLDAVRLAAMIDAEIKAMEQSETVYTEEILIDEEE